MHMLQRLAAPCILGTIVGCGSTSNRPSVVQREQPATAPWTVAITPQRAREWTPEEAKAVLVARAALDEQAKRANAPAPDIIEFRVTPEPNGWSVYVEFVGYYVDGKAGPAPGYFTVVEIDREWNVTRTIGGA